MKTLWQRWKRWRAKRLFLTIVSMLLVGGLLFFTFSIFDSQKSQISSPSTAEQGRPTSGLTSGNSRTFVPKPLAKDIELNNPQRGPQYYGDEAPPPGWPLTDRYKRWCWGDIELQQREEQI